MELIRATKAEFFKMRKTKALWLSLLAPFAVAALQFLVIMLSTRQGLDPNIWNMHMDSDIMLWVIMTLPMYMSLGAAVIANIETSSNSWKQVFSTSVSRSSIYLAKLFNGLIFLFISSVVLGLLTIGTGYLAGVFHPDFYFLKSSPDIMRLVKLLSIAYGSIFLVLTAQLWLATRVKSFILPAGLGVVGIISNFILVNSEKFARFSPWMFPVTTFMNETRKTTTEYFISTPKYLAISIIAGVVITVLAVIDLRRRDVL